MIGRDFTGNALTSLLAAEGLGAPGHEILDRLVRRRILIRVNPDAFRFAQPLMQRQRL